MKTAEQARRRVALRCTALLTFATISILCPGAVKRSAPMHGSVEIDSTPSGARIEINGVYVGETPFTWKVGQWALDPHKHWGHVEAPQRADYPCASLRRVTLLTVLGNGDDRYFGGLPELD